MAKRKAKKGRVQKNETVSTVERLAPYRDLLPEDDFAQLVAAVDLPLAQAIRVNRLKFPVDVLDTWTTRYDWPGERLPFCDAGYQFSVYQRGVARTVEYKNGGFFIMDAASMLPGELFSPVPDEASPLILDMAASPGGKTTHIVDRFMDRAVIVANDKSAGRIPALRASLQGWGATGALVTQFSGERFGGWFPETFDKVLLDAPCSGETLRETTGSRSRPVSVRERQGLHQRQVSLLKSALAALKVGGEVVYATCTLAPPEDEAVLDAVLAAYGAAITVEASGLPIDAPALTAAHGENYAPAVGHGLRMWPHLYNTSGFFTARLRKLDVIDAPAEAPPLRDLGASGWLVMDTAQVDALAAQLRDAFGFDLEKALPLHVFIQRGEHVHAVREAAITHFGGLPFAAVGLMIGQFIEGDFIPSREIITRFVEAFTAGWFTLDDIRAEQWLQGIELRGEVDFPPGTILLMRDAEGRFLGRGKVLRDRVRNLLPKGGRP